MPVGDLFRRLLFLFALALFPIFLLAPAAAFTAVASLALTGSWWLPAVAAAGWLAWRSRLAWRVGAPGQPEVRLPIPRQAGDPLWDLTIRAAKQVGSTEPTAIELVGEPNAEVAALDGGIVVRIGLPLLACYPTDDIAAVIAHELSHASLGHLGSWRFEHRCMEAFVRLAKGTKPGVQRMALILHLKLAEFVVLPDKRRDETEADRLATASTGADAFASALLRTQAVADAWERGAQVFFGLPRLTGLYSSRLDGVRDLTAGSAASDAVDLADEDIWSTHPGTGRRLELAGAQWSQTTLAPADRADLVLPWRELLAAEAELDDTGSTRFPAAPWEESWQPALTAALRDVVRDPVFAWSLPGQTPRDLLLRLAAGRDEIVAELGSTDTELCQAVAALAGVQQGVVRFHWHDAAGIADLSAGLAAVAATTARGWSGDLPLAALLEVPPAEFATGLAAIGIDLDHPLDLVRRPEEPAVLRALLVACRLDARHTTISLPDGLAAQQGWHALLLNTGVALTPARNADTMDALLNGLADTVYEVCGFGWRPDDRTIWVPRESVSSVTLAKRRARVTLTSTAGVLTFAADPSELNPAPFLSLWGRARVAV